MNSNGKIIMGDPDLRRDPHGKAGLSFRGTVVSAIVVFMFFSASPLIAGTYQWDGSTGSLWDDAANWTVAGKTPAKSPGANDDVVFYISANNLRTELGHSYAIESLTFTSTATQSSSIEGGYNLAIGAGGITIQAGSASHEINNSRIVLRSDQNWTNDSSSALTVSGRVLMDQTLSVIGSGDVLLAGQLSGIGSLIKSGGGTLTLSAENSYAGGTTVNSGVLVVSDTSALGTGQAVVNSGGTIQVATGVSVVTPIVLNSGGTLDIEGDYNGPLSLNGGTVHGSGAINTNVTVVAGGRISPGTSPGSMTFAAGLDLSGGGEYYWELGNLTESGPGVNYDIIYVTGGNLVLGGSSVLSINFTGGATNPDLGDTFWDAQRQWKIIDQSGTNSTNFNTLLNGSYAAGSFSSVIGSGANVGDIYLSWTPVPEPGTIVLLAIGGMLVILRRRKVAAAQRLSR